MTADDLRTVYAYNRWANGRVRDVAARLSSEQLARDLGSSYGSVRDTLAHILSAEWIWLERCRGVSPAAMLDPSRFPDVATLRDRWRTVEDGQESLLETLTDDALARVLRYTNTRGEVWEYALRDVLYHVVNHSSYHRGQLTTMFRQLGARPIETDYLVFLDERRAESL